MKPPPFAYAAPATVEEAVELLATEGARVLAGGQSLVPLMNAHAERPAALVDVNRIAELSNLGVNGGVTAGAVVRADRLARDGAVRGRLAVLADAAARVGHPAVRNRGTVGGNLAFADPANNLPVVAVALDAELLVRSTAGERAIPAARFFRGAYATALESGELLCEASFPTLPDGAGSAYYEVSRRSRGWGLAGAAAAVWLAADGTIGGARIALGGVAAAPLRMHAAEVALTGAAPGDEAFAAAGAAARDAITDAREDLHASAEHRRRLAAVVVERALRAASARAEGRA
jgi:aerobic carbon-monoxide dehydrogenase medium subunit